MGTLHVNIDGSDERSDEDRQRRGAALFHRNIVGQRKFREQWIHNDGPGTAFSTTTFIIKFLLLNSDVFNLNGYEAAL